jgi:hypothetical protein
VGSEFVSSHAAQNEARLKSDTLTLAHKILWHVVEEMSLLVFA